MQFAPTAGGAVIRVGNENTSILGSSEDIARAKGYADTTLFAPFAINDHSAFAF
jgi:hypothetical protein